MKQQQKNHKSHAKREQKNIQKLEGKVHIKMQHPKRGHIGAKRCGWVKYGSIENNKYIILTRQP